MMISRSGDILEIYVFIKNVIKMSASYQHNTTDTNKLRHMKLLEM